jgi:hypothetical protein
VTAIGVFLMLASLAVAVCIPIRRRGGFGFHATLVFFLVGAFLFSAGVGVWLWRVMP